MSGATEELIVAHIAHTESPTDVQTAFSAGVEAHLTQDSIYQAFERGVADRRVSDVQTEVLAKFGYLFGGVVAMCGGLAYLVGQNYEAMQTSLERAQQVQETAQSNTYVFGGMAVICGIAGGIQHWRAKQKHRQTEEISRAMADFRPRVR